MGRIWNPRRQLGCTHSCTQYPCPDLAAIELPGVDKKNIDLRVNENNLEVYAKTGQKKEAVKKGQYVASASAQEYYRVLPFPAPVQAGKAKASYKNGVLCVEVPKARGAQSNRIIIE